MEIQKPQNKPYVLLSGVIPLDEDGQVFNRLLGLVTTNLARPLDSCRPEAPFRARDHFQEPTHLYPSTPTECINASWLVEASVGENAKAEISRLLSLRGGRSKQQDNDYSMTLLRQIEIPVNATQRIRELLEIPEYLQGIRQLMSSQTRSDNTRTLGVVAGFITCSDLTFNKERSSTLEVGGSAGLASEQAFGVPGANVIAEASLKHAKHGSISGTYKGEVVVACYYLPIHGSVAGPRDNHFSLFGSFKFNLNLGPRSSERLPTVDVKPIKIVGVHIRDHEYVGGDIRRPLGIQADQTSKEADEPEETCENPQPTKAVDFYIGMAPARDGIAFESTLSD